MFTLQEARPSLGLFVSLLAAFTLAACSGANEPAPMPGYKEVPTWTVTPADSLHASPTATLIPTLTPRPPTVVPPTRTPRPTTARACNLEDVPEPPLSTMDCEIWETSYIVQSLALGRPALASEFDRIAQVVYPVLQAGAQVCGVSPMQFGLYIITMAEELQKEGKPSSIPDAPISYLIGYFETFLHTGALHELIRREGGCVEALALMTAMIE